MKPDHPEADCPMLLLLDGLADRWAVGGVSQKMLSQTLRGLERDGLTTPTATPTAPVTVEYAITPLGETLARTMTALHIWSIDNIGEVMAARAAFDARNEARAEAAAWPHQARRVS